MSFFHIVYFFIQAFQIAGFRIICLQILQTFNALLYAVLQRLSLIHILSRLIKDKTVLVIAHRMRTVSGADKVVVLSEGTVAEQGAPEELMSTGKIYPHMVKLQMNPSE